MLMSPTPAVCRQERRFPFDETIGTLIARSSRIMEPVIFEVVDEVVGRKGPFACWRSAAAPGSTSGDRAAETPS